MRKKGRGRDEGKREVKWEEGEGKREEGKVKGKGMEGEGKARGKRRARDEGKGINQVEKWEGEEGNRGSCNFIHSCLWVGTTRNSVSHLAYL